MIRELANKHRWWQVGSVPFLLTEYHKSKVSIALIYIQHSHMVCGKFHICHDLFFDQTVKYNAYSTPLLHEALDMNHKMVMLGMSLYHNTFSHICVKNLHYPEHDTLCMSILAYWIFSYISLINVSMFTMLLIHMFLEIFGQTDIIFWCEKMH